MYLRTTTRRNKDGTTVRYLQLAHNRWDPIRKRSVARVLHSFGREDEVDASLLARLVASLNRTLGFEPASATEPVELNGADVELSRLRPVSARPVGPCWLLGGVWRQLGLDRTLRRQLRSRGQDPALEEAILLLVTDRVLQAPVGGYVVPWARRACLPQAAELHPARADEARRALLAVVDDLADAVQQVLGPAATPLVIDAAPQLWDAALISEVPPPMLRGAVVLALSAEGLPVQLWVHPASPDPGAVADQVRAHLEDRTAALPLLAGSPRAVTAAAPVVPPPSLPRLEVHSLRELDDSGNALLDEPGRFRALGAGVAVRRVRSPSDPGATVLVRLDELRERDAAARSTHAAQLDALLAGTDDLDDAERARIRAGIDADPALARQLRVTAGGLLRCNRTVLRDDARRDGILLAWCDDPSWSVDELARAVAALYRSRAASGQLACRPAPPATGCSSEVHAEVALCWLALLLVRCIELACEQPWSEVRQVLTEHRAIEHAGRDGRVIETVLPSESQRQYYRRCDVDPPPRFLDVIPEHREVSAGGG